MKSKHLQFTLKLLVTSLILAGCATVPIEESPSPDSKLMASVEPANTTALKQASDTTFTTRDYYRDSGRETDAKNINIEAIPVSSSDTEPAPIQITSSSAQTYPESGPTKTEAVQSSTSDETYSSMPDKVMVVTRMDSVDRELSYTDSISYLVIIQPNDYLGRIAMREYNNPRLWRNIYYWNRELIGDDPNVLYPYLELKLFKPEHEIASRSYDYIIHAVIKGETLWSIAGDWYGDNLAWTLVYSDNEELFISSGGRLNRGMELKIRTQLIDSFSIEPNLSIAK